MDDIKPLNTEVAKPLNLYQRISYAISLFQDGKINPPEKSQIGTGNYSYMAFLAESIVSAGNNAFRKAGLVLITNECTSNIINYDIEVKSATQTRVEAHIIASFKLINIDNPSEFEIITIPAMGQGNDDKAINKALTYAQKYAIMHILKLQDGFDGDAEVSEAVLIKRKNLTNITITLEQAQEIDNLIQTKCVDSDKLLSYYKVVSLSDMTAKQAEHAIKQLQSK